MAIIEYAGLMLWIKRLGWLLLIWSASVLALLAAAYVMRFFMRLIGLG